MMKRYVIVGMIFMIGFLACDDGSDNVGESQIDTSTPLLNDLDIWLRESFVNPYNIEILYKWDVNDTDISRFLHPPFESSVRPVVEALQKIWIEPYTQLGGADFIKNIAPRQFTMVGGLNLDPLSPTRTLGIAEAGTKITLFEIDYLDFTNINSVTQPLRTVQHEYAHILNQNIPFDIEYGQINPENYNSNWFNRTSPDARELGYITAYASSQEGEDFVEMVAEMLTRTKEDFDALVDSIVSDESRAIIRLKESMVVEYYQTHFGINLYELQELTNQATLELVN